MKKVKSISVFLIPVILLLAGFAGWHGYRLVYIGTGYMAKMMCSLIFISNMDPEKIAAEDIYDPMLAWFGYEVDYQNRTVQAWGPFGLAGREARFYPCSGALLQFADYDEVSLFEPDTSLCRAFVRPEADWPAWDRLSNGSLPENIAHSALNTVLEEAFSEPDPDHLRHTRAVVILHRGRIIAEGYAPPFHAQTRFLGWSMTKSITGALVGILAGEGKLDLHAPVDLPEWHRMDDPRSRITLDQLLRMTSGLEFEEAYNDPLSDVVRMLFGLPDAAAFAAAKRLAFPPGTHWSYSSGTTNIIMRIIRNRFESYRDYRAYPYAYLFHKIGMYSAILETDPSGTFVGSSFCYATARDWARFGQLYLQDGVWEGERILPEGWVDYSVHRTTLSKNEKFGAHFWRLPAGQTETPGIPEDMFWAAGHDGQFVNIVPASELVIVRLGMNKHSEAWNQNEFVAKIIAAIGPR